jgi:Domain of unknown function (DUF4188)
MSSSSRARRGVIKRGPTKPEKVDRVTVDLDGYPDLVVVYLGMPVRRPRGLLRLLRLGPQIAHASRQQPDGLLLHEAFIWSLFPPHAGLRQYWRDFDSLERWTRSEPHRNWWREFFKDTGGTAFWHEAYFVGDRAEAVYDGLSTPTGFARFAPTQPARGSKFSSRYRAKRGGPQVAPPVVDEESYYRDESHTTSKSEGVTP